MNVLVYTGPEGRPLPSSVSRSITALRSVLYPNYTVQAVTQQSLASAPWPATCALLVLPACQDSLAFAPPLSSTIKAYIENGGALLGIRAGVKVGAPAFETPEHTFRVQETNSKHTLYCKLAAGPGDPSKRVAIESAEEVVVEGILESGEASFEGLEKVPDARILARRADDKRVVAAVFDVGSGRVALWGVHIEAPVISQDGTSEDRDAEEGRKALFRATLSAVGLQVPAVAGAAMLQPLPQLLISAPNRPTATTDVLKSLGISPPEMFEDATDTFAFHPATDAEELLQKCRQSEPVDKPRHIIVYGNGDLPSSTLTPMFDLGQYFAHLEAARKNSQSATGETWGIGEAMLYGEVVTSTQTLLDKNLRFLSQLPAPLLSLATHQVAGRGRGGNSWVSPIGCLQFSLRLRISLTTFPATRLVFIQYLVALAVVEACRDPAVLGEHGSKVRIKWPNDVYVVRESGEHKTTKVAGILVYTTFDGTSVDIVIGCGINLLNPPPIASLASLLPSEAQAPTMERTAAILMAKFEAMWKVFVENRGSFDPFMDLYLDRWLHSDQRVTLTTNTPHRRVRIVGITHDHGLLRTIPEDGGYGGAQDFIDLQPDGNTFDLMAGLIMTKTK